MEAATSIYLGSNQQPDQYSGSSHAQITRLATLDSLSSLLKKTEAYSSYIELLLIFRCGLKMSLEVGVLFRPFQMLIIK